MSFGGNTKHCRSLLSGVYARGSKTCNLSRRTAHSSLEKDNSLSQPLLAPKYGLFGAYITKTYVSNRTPTSRLRLAESHIIYKLPFRPLLLFFANAACTRVQIPVRPLVWCLKLRDAALPVIMLTLPPAMTQSHYECENSQWQLINWTLFV